MEFHLNYEWLLEDKHLLAKENYFFALNIKKMIRILYQNDLKSLFYIFFYMWHRNTMN